MVRSSNLSFISANIVDAESGDLVFNPYIISERNGIKIGVIGLTNKLPAVAKELKLDDYVTAGQKYIDLIESEVDVLVLMVDAERKLHEKLKTDFSSADYIFVSRHTSRTYPSTPQSDSGPLFYSAGVQGKWLAEINLTITDPDLPIADISASQEQILNVDKRFKSLQKRDPDKSLEEMYADNPNVMKIIDDYRKKKEQAEQNIAQAINKSRYHSIALDKKIPDDDSLNDLVKLVLKECRKLDSQSGAGKGVKPIKLTKKRN